jgi:hypothetical protein
MIDRQHARRMEQRRRQRMIDWQREQRIELERRRRTLAVFLLATAGSFFLGLALHRLLGLCC